MNEKDDTLLEYLESISPSAAPPKVIHWNITDQGLGQWSMDTTRRRLDKLEASRLVEVVYQPGKYYRVTDEGLEYLSGNLDVSELDE